MAGYESTTNVNKVWEFCDIGPFFYKRVIFATGEVTATIKFEKSAFGRCPYIENPSRFDCLIHC